MSIKIILFLVFIILSATLFPSKINAQENEEEEEYYAIYDKYRKIMIKSTLKIML